MRVNFSASIGNLNSSIQILISQGYTQLYASFESFYTRHVYRRVRDGWTTPISSVPGGYVTLVERVSDDYGWTFR